MSNQDTDSYHYHGEIDTPRPPMEDGTLLASPNWVVNTVHALVSEPTEPDPHVLDLLTDRQSVVQEARKCDIAKSDAEVALDEAIAQKRIFAAPEWGHLAPLSDEHLLAVQEAEREAGEQDPDTDADGDDEEELGHPRKAFIGKCHEARMLAREREGTAVDAIEVADD